MDDPVGGDPDREGDDDDNDGNGHCRPCKDGGCKAVYRIMSLAPVHFSGESSINKVFEAFHNGNSCHTLVKSLTKIVVGVVGDDGGDDAGFGAVPVVVVTTCGGCCCCWCCL